MDIVRKVGRLRTFFPAGDAERYVASPVMVILSKQLEVFADYHQFYLWDSAMSPLAPEEFSEGDVARRIKTGRNVVVIQPERSLAVPVIVEIHDCEPELISE